MAAHVKITIAFCILSLTSVTLTSDTPSVKLAKANNEFSLKMYQNQVDKKGRWENVFFSPLSITMATGLVHVGSRGNTRKQIEEVMEFTDIGTNLYPGFQQLTELMNAPGNNYTLKLANRLFGRNNFTYLDDFLQDTNTYFKATLKELDFSGDTEGSRKFINDWVATYTEDKIKDLLPRGFVSASTVLVLVNAVYFKGGWMHVFDSQLTAKDKFWLTETQNYQTDMMSYADPEMELRHATVSEWDCQVVELPYLEDELHMYILVPSDKEGLVKLENNLEHSKLEDIITNKMSRTAVTLTMPKFKMTIELALKEAFEKLGMVDLFDPGLADLSGITGSKGLYASGAVHKAFIDVNEVGTEAAAATAIGIDESAAAETTTVKVDRPFIFLIREQTTGMVLFMGRYIVPEGAESMVPDLTLSNDSNISHQTVSSLVTLILISVVYIIYRT